MGMSGHTGVAMGGNGQNSKRAMMHFLFLLQNHYLLHFTQKHCVQQNEIIQHDEQGKKCSALHDVNLLTINYKAPK